jgi:hypothetical protein
MKDCIWGRDEKFKVYSAVSAREENFMVVVLVLVLVLLSLSRERYYELGINCPPSVSDSSQTVPR